MKSELNGRPVAKTTGLKRKASDDGLGSSDTETLTVSFRCTKLKRVTKRLLVLQGRCENGWKNRLKPNNPALLHVVASSCRLPQDVESVETLVKKYFLSNKTSHEGFCKGCWTEMDTEMLVVVRVRANLELNRRGDRIIECVDVLAIQEAEDESFFPVDYDDVFHQYMLPNDTAVASLCAKSERHIVFCDWIMKTFGSCIYKGSGVLDVAG